MPIGRKKTKAMTPEELAVRFLEGDDQAFERIFAEHNPRLFAYCMKMVKDRSVAEDLAQETWVRTIGLRTRERGSVENLYGMIYRIARNLSLDHLKSYRESNRVEIEAGELERRIGGADEKSPQEEMVLRALEKLSFDYRETIVLHTYSGYSYEEIAEMLGKSPEAIWARASRARKKLRGLVAEEIRQEEGALSLLTKGRKDQPRRYHAG